MLYEVITPDVEAVPPFEPVPEIASVSIGLARDAYLARWEADGRFAWARRMGGSGANTTQVLDVAVTPNGLAISYNFV